MMITKMIITGHNNLNVRAIGILTEEIMVGMMNEICRRGRFLNNKDLLNKREI